MLNYAKAEFRASYGLKSQLPAPSGPEVVFSGRSNVGKSSLINKLCMRKSLARVAPRREKRPPSIFTGWTQRGL